MELAGAAAGVGLGAPGWAEMERVEGWCGAAGVDVSTAGAVRSREKKKDRHERLPSSAGLSARLGMGMYYMVMCDEHKERAATNDARQSDEGFDSSAKMFNNKKARTTI